MFFRTRISMVPNNNSHGKVMKITKIHPWPMCKSCNHYPVNLMQMKNGSFSFYCGQWGVLESKG